MLAGGISAQKLHGVEVLFKYGRKLVGDRTKKCRLVVVKVTESQFADDVALYSGSRIDFELAARTFVHVAREWGLTVNTHKDKRAIVV